MFLSGESSGNLFYFFAIYIYIYIYIYYFNVKYIILNVFNNLVC